jgi:D-xylose reductase
LVKWVQEQGIQITAYSSFGPASFVSLGVNQAITAAPLLEHDVISAIAKANNKTPAQVLLRWSVEKGICVIPKSSSEGRMVSNHDITSWTLSEEDMAKIADLDLNLRFNDPCSYGFNLPIFN